MRFDQPVWATRLQLLWMCFGVLYAIAEHVTHGADNVTRQRVSAAFILCGGFLIILMLMHLYARSRADAPVGDRDQAIFVVAFGIACLAARTSFAFEDTVGVAIASIWGLALAYMTWRSNTSNKLIVAALLPMLVASFVAGLTTLIVRLLLCALGVAVAGTADPVTVAGFVALFGGWWYREQLMPQATDSGSDSGAARRSLCRSWLVRVAWWGAFTLCLATLLLLDAHHPSEATLVSKCEMPFRCSVCVIGIICCDVLVCVAIWGLPSIQAAWGRSLTWFLSIMALGGVAADFGARLMLTLAGGATKDAPFSWVGGCATTLAIGFSLTATQPLLRRCFPNRDAAKPRLRR